MASQLASSQPASVLAMPPQRDNWKLFRRDPRVGIVVVNVLGDLGRLTYKANKFVSFGLTLADSDMTGNGINFLPDAGGLNVLRHFIFDMCKVSGS